ncbi:MAG: transporter substrate-binding protein [Burkholderiales bacterium]|jgi:tripartite-type tricarboxylate transporter receptor subunit TctC|nr:transporter substrate-binding protein [Burkholderiales bacterium]
MKSLLFAFILAATLATPASAFAQAAYPSKPVRLIVPYPPGGGTDTMARTLGQKLTEALGQQVIVDNRPGGGANIGAELAAKSPPDGYTLLMCTIAHATAGSLYRKLGYDVVRDFTPVSLLATTPHILVLHPSVPVKSMKELIALAKKRPNELVYSSSGSGTPAHLAGELFKHMAGVSMVHVPYKGGGPSVVALLSGEVALAFATTPSVIGHVKGGRLRAVAVTTAKRSVATPELPTIGELGISGYDVGSWYGLLAPTGTQKEIVARLNSEAHKALRQPDVKQRLDASGFEALTSTPEEYGAFLRGEVEKWAKVVKAAGVRAD